ncbi:hypothetical protein ACOSQ3_031759 [Xanthoceras sorbifolium]
MTKSNRTLEDILQEFSSRFTGTLREWYQSLIYVGSKSPSTTVLDHSYPTFKSS